MSRKKDQGRLDPGLVPERALQRRQRQQVQTQGSNLFLAESSLLPKVPRHWTKSHLAGHLFGLAADI